MKGQRAELFDPIFLRDIETEQKEQKKKKKARRGKGEGEKPIIKRKREISCLNARQTDSFLLSIFLLFGTDLYFITVFIKTHAKMPNPQSQRGHRK